MANKFAKLSTSALEKKIGTASDEDKVQIQEVLDKRKAADAAKADFLEIPAKKVSLKADFGEPAEKPAKKSKKAVAEPEAPKSKKAVKAEEPKVKVNVKKAKAAKPARERHELIGKTAKFTVHGTAFEIKGPIVRVINGTDDKPYIGVADENGKIKFKQQEQATIYGMKAK
jgi:hypothetical protein